MYLMHYFSNNLLYYRAKSAWLFPPKTNLPLWITFPASQRGIQLKALQQVSKWWLNTRDAGVWGGPKWFPPPLWICACHRCDVMATRSCDWTVGSGREKKQQRGRNVSVASEIQLEVLSGVFRQKRTFNEKVRAALF